MEWNFLGIGGKDSAAEKAGFLGSSAVHCPFSSNNSAKQKFFNCEAAQEERPKQIMFDHLPSSGFQLMTTVGAFDPTQRPHSAFVSQKHLGIDRQGIHHFQLPGYPALVVDPFSTSVVHHSNERRTFPAVPTRSVAIAAGFPFLNKVGGSANGSNLEVTSLKQPQPFVGGSTLVPAGGCSMTSAFVPRNTTKPSGSTAQLTLFYAGTVNVYDDVPLEKAQAIMFLAANGSNLNSNAVNVRSQWPVMPSTKPAEDEAINMKQTPNMNKGETQRNAQPCAMLSSTKSATSHLIIRSGTGHSSTDDLTGAKATGSLVPTGEHEPPKGIVTAVALASGANLIPRAIPQARKASLARFLEKRKERVTIAAPYPSPQKSLNCTSESDGKSMTAETAHSSSKEHSWRAK